MKKIALVPFLLISQFTSAELVQEYTFNSGVEGWTAAANITGLTASGGVLTGTASSNDPQLSIGSVNLTPGGGETWSTLVFRVRENQDEAPSGFLSTFNATGLVVIANNAGGLTINNIANFSAVDSGNNFFTVTVDISSYAATTITQLRLDPIGGAASNSVSETNGNSFEIDFVQLYDTAAVPEPGAFALISGFLGLLFVVARRR
jgi:hypothetical protein